MFLRVSPGTPRYSHTCRKSQRHPLAFHHFSQLNRSSSSQTSEYHPSLQTGVLNLKSMDQLQKDQEAPEVTTKFSKAVPFSQEGTQILRQTLKRAHDPSERLTAATVENKG